MCNTCLFQKKLKFHKWHANFHFFQTAILANFYNFGNTDATITAITHVSSKINLTEYAVFKETLV
jgi:hypothetical protein